MKKRLEFISLAAALPHFKKREHAGVFPTHRNSGLSGQALRAAQEAFARVRLLEGHPAETIRGQAGEAGLTVLEGNSRLADPGAENAVQHAIDWYNRQQSNAGYR